MHLFLKISNILAYVVFLHATIHNTVDFTDDGLIRHKETYITPSSWVSDIWVIIHLLLGGFTIYQWFEPAHKATTYGVGWYFVLSAILSYVWLTLLIYGYIITGIIFNLLIASAVSLIFYRLTNNYPAITWFDTLFIHAPFSIWHSWIIYAAVVTVFEKLDNPDIIDGSSIWMRILAILAILILTSISISYANYKRHRRDVICAFVISVGLFAIYTNQDDPWIYWMAFTCTILSCLYALCHLKPAVTGSSTLAENEPLITRAL